jgi:chemotaxis response regulator CheB
MVRVYVVDDSGLLRQRLIDTVSETQGVDVVGEAGDVSEAETSIWAFKPDAVILAGIFHELMSRDREDGCAT